MKHFFHLTFITSIVLFLVNTTAISQELSLSAPYRVIDADSKYYFLKNNEILSLKIDRDNFYIQKFNADKPAFIKFRLYKDMPKNHVIESVSEFKGRFYVFYSLWDKSNETEQLFYREIDFAKGEFIGSGTLLMKSTKKITGTLTATGFYNFGMSDKFKILTSSDTSRILIYYRVKPDIRNDEKSYDVIGMTVVDPDLKTVWTKEITMPYTEKKMNNIDYSVDSDGNAYILSTVYDDNTTDIKKDNEDKVNYHIELLKIKGNVPKIEVTPIKLADKFISRIWLYESPGKYMICAGFYNNGKAKQAADGVLLFKVSPEGKVFDIASYEIPVAVLNQYVSEKTQKRNEKADAKGNAQFQNLVLRKLVIDKDGSILLIGEQYYVETRTYTMNGRVTTTYQYHYNDMLATKINADGKLAWMQKLPKRQVGSHYKGGMGLKYIRHQNNHYFLFLDNIKNLGLSVNEAPEQHMDGAGGFLTAYKVDNAKGTFEKISMLDTRDVQGTEIYQFNTNRILLLTSNSFVVEAYKKRKEDILIKVKIDD